MRKLETIQTKANLNEIYAMDEKGIGNANHKYMIKSVPNGKQERFMRYIEFQNGARLDPNSTNGVLDCDLLEIVRDRLIGFQTSEFSCEYNAKALYYVLQALKCMNQRVEDRLERNILGTYDK